MSLPPLPEQRNVALIQGFEGSEYRNLSYDYCETTAKHSINQMREYGALCRKMALEEAAKLCDEVQAMYGQYTFSARVSAERIRELLNR